MKTVVNELQERLIAEGFIAFNYCEFESVDNQDMEHVHFLKPGEEAFGECYDKQAAPILSDHGERLLEDYLAGKPLILTPDPKSL